MKVGNNAIYNLAGSLAPILIAILTLPIYIRLIGAERYGALNIAWLLGYFGLFDIGLGRAATKGIAGLRNGTGQQRSEVFWAALIANTLMAVLAMAAIYLIGWYFFAEHFQVSEGLRAEMLAALPLIAIAVPIAMTIGLLAGAMQGREMFLDSNLTGIVSSSLFQLLPLLLALFGHIHLVELIAAGVLGRLIGMLLYFQRVQRRMLAGTTFRFDRAQVRPLFAFGGWISVTAMIIPLFMVADRFLIGAILSAVAVTIYTVPYEIVQRISLIPRALSLAVFPRLASTDPAEGDVLADKAIRSIITVVSPMALIGILIMHPFLDIWIGPKLAAQAVPIALILILSFWVNSFAVIPLSQLQAIGKPDVVAKLLIVELPCYAVIFYVALTQFGLMGAAFTFLIRNAVDGLLLTWFARRRLSFPGELYGAAALLAAAVFITLNYYGQAAHWWPGVLLCGGLLVILLARNVPPELRPMIARVVPAPVLRLLRFR